MSRTTAVLALAACGIAILVIGWFARPGGEASVLPRELPHEPSRAEPRDGVATTTPSLDLDSTGDAARRVALAAKAAPNVGTPNVVSLRGRVLDRAGLPSTALELLVQTHELDLVLRSDAVADRMGEDIIARDVLAGAGLTRVWVTTDAEGNFEASGLRPDRYDVRVLVEDAFTGDTMSGLLTDEPVEAGGPSLSLTFGRPHLIVDVVDDRGRPLELEDPMRRRGHEPGGTPTRWPANERLCVVPALDAAQPGTTWLARQEPPGSGGRHVVEVVAGATYLVGLYGGSQAWRPARVEVPVDAGRVPVRVVVAPASEVGRVRVDAHAGDRRIEYGLRFACEDFATGIVLFENRVPTGFPFEVELPAGEYRVVVEGAYEPPHVDGHGSTSRHGRFESRAIVRSNETVVIDARPGVGARLDLRLQGEPDDLDREGYRRHETTNRANEDRAFRAELRLVEAMRAPRIVHFTTDPSGPTPIALHDTTRLPLGGRAISELLPAGAFTLEAALPSGRVARTRVELIDGETTTVTLRMPPRPVR